MLTNRSDQNSPKKFQISPSVINLSTISKVNKNKCKNPDRKISKTKLKSKGDLRLKVSKIGKRQRKISQRLNLSKELMDVYQKYYLPDGSMREGPETHKPIESFRQESTFTNLQVLEQINIFYETYLIFLGRPNTE